MKPLLSVISYNRKQETVATLRALQETGTFEQAQVVIFDNGSTDGTREAIQEMTEDGFSPYVFHFQPQNIGCPRALNFILKHWRQLGQHFIKVDNDVQIETPEWVAQLELFLDIHKDVGMVGPWYDELETGYQGRVLEQRVSWWSIFPIIGHCVMHRGELLDRTGYFDVLAPDHLYGFEDLLMAHRAGALGWTCAIDRTVRLRNIQRKNSLDYSAHEGERMKQHTDRLRAEYNRRCHEVHAARGAYTVGPAGQRRTDPCL